MRAVYEIELVLWKPGLTSGFRASNERALLHLHSAAMSKGLPTCGYVANGGSKRLKVYRRDE
ncbi:MAG: hypothetical protein AAGF25_15420, partial [Pseudomonadota bacterium]